VIILGFTIENLHGYVATPPVHSLGDQITIEFKVKSTTRSEHVFY